MLDAGKNHFPKLMYTPVFQSKLFIEKNWHALLSEKVMDKTI